MLKKNFDQIHFCEPAERVEQAVYIEFRCYPLCKYKKQYLFVSLHERNFAFHKHISFIQIEYS